MLYQLYEQLDPHHNLSDINYDIMVNNSPFACRSLVSMALLLNRISIFGATLIQKQLPFVRNFGRGGNIVSSSSEDSWERWEYGDEAFIDASMTTTRRNDHRHLRPMKNGKLEYMMAAQALWPFLSSERVEKMKRVVELRSGQARFVFENPITPSNVWACLRTLDSFGIQFVDVIADPTKYLNAEENPKLMRMQTACGANLLC
jgi:hypothetical protein